jgi:acyl-CoA dehydrogenase
MSDIDLLEEVVREMLDDRAGAVGPGELDRPLLTVLADAGLLRLGVPEERGGSGGGLVEAATVVRLVAEYAAQVPVAEGLVAASLLAEAGLAVPEGVLTFCARSVPGALAEGRVTGPSRRVPYGRHADHVIVLLSGEDGHLVIDGAVEGSVLVAAHGANLAGEPRDDVTPAQPRITPVSAGVARSALLRARLFAAMTIAGAAQRAVALAVRHTGERIQFGRPLSAFQAIQQQLAQAASETAAARCAADEAANDPTELAVAAAKLRCNRAVGLVAAVTHQVHGAIGVTLEHPLHRSTTLMLARRDESGTDAELGAALVGATLSEAGLWPALVGD